MSAKIIISKRPSYVGEEQNNKLSVTKQAKEYADAASIHGIKYISEDGRHSCER